MRPKIRKLVSLLALLPAVTTSQNRLNLQMEGGEPFKAIIRDQVVNAAPQSHVMINDLKEDTLLVKIELETGIRYGVTLYLLEKGKPTKGKDFNYLIRKEKNRLRPVFMGMYEMR